MKTVFFVFVMTGFSHTFFSLSTQLCVIANCSIFDWYQHVHQYKKDPGNILLLKPQPTLISNVIKIKIPQDFVEDVNITDLDIEGHENALSKHCHIRLLIFI